ncbi:MAG TPA: ArdC family protein [Solirubrobacterales bacterium]|jgi:antirestriction protein ArdC|nr:ArdC family protein [Solirubrobacterales bacterium]
MAKNRRRKVPTEEERAERRAAERELMADAIEKLRSSEGWQRWLRVRRHFHTYSFHNQLLIAHQCPHATRVAGFRRWLELGYAVRKGEHGIRIWAPCPPSKKKLREWRQAGADPETKPRTYFRLAAVFDRSQVEPLPEFPGGPVDLELPIEPVEGEGLAHLFEPLANFGASLGFPVSVEEIPGAAQGFCDRGAKRIAVEVVGERFSANAQVSVAVHELAHALVGCERREEDPALTYAEEEVVVECVAFSVCSTVGLDTAGASVPYMTSWSKGEEIERYAELIDRLASRLEDAALAVITPEEDKVAVSS